jgi:hypothetical protein
MFDIAADGEFDDYARSCWVRRSRLPTKKTFYEKALAPLGMTLLTEFSEVAAGFGKDDGSRPSFFIEAHGEPVRGRLHIALGAENRAQVDTFHAAAVQAGGTETAHPGFGGTTPSTTAATSSIRIVSFQH